MVQRVITLVEWFRLAHIEVGVLHGVQESECIAHSLHARRSGVAHLGFGH